MKRIHTRWIAVLLAMVLCLGLVQTTAFAADDDAVVVSSDESWSNKTIDGDVYKERLGWCGHNIQIPFFRHCPPFLSLFFCFSGRRRSRGRIAKQENRAGVFMWISHKRTGVLLYRYICKRITRKV